MSKKAIERQAILLKYLKEERTVEELYQLYKDEGFCSKQAKKPTNFYNDLKSLRDSGFRIEKKSGTYKFISENLSEIQIYLMKYRSMVLAYEKIMSSNSDNLNYLLFEPVTKSFNFSVFEKMFEAVCNGKAVVFNHKKFKQGSVEKEYYFEPNVLKEYQNRWYVIGKTEKGYRTFSLERISNLKITDKPITIDIDNIEERLSATIGVSFNGETIKSKYIKLKIDNSQKEYIKTTPIFKHQKIIQENETHFILELTVGNTVELRQQILKYGRRIEVLEPKELRQQIFEEIKDLYKMYE